MHRLVYLVPKGRVELLQEIEARLGDVAKNPSAVIRRAFPAHQLLSFQAIQQAGYTRRPFNHPLCDVQCRKPLQTCASQDAQDVELLGGDAMFAEHW